MSRPATPGRQDQGTPWRDPVGTTTSAAASSSSRGATMRLSRRAAAFPRMSAVAARPRPIASLRRANSRWAFPCSTAVASSSSRRRTPVGATVTAYSRSTSLTYSTRVRGPSACRRARTSTRPVSPDRSCRSCRVRLRTDLSNSDTRATRPGPPPPRDASRSSARTRRSSASWAASVSSGGGRTATRGSALARHRSAQRRISAGRPSARASWMPSLASSAPWLAALARSSVAPSVDRYSSTTAIPWRAPAWPR